MKRDLFLFGIIFLIFSCKKTPPPAPVSASDYLPMKPGNYWIYAGFSGDTNGVSANSNAILDSVWVEKDTTIKGNTYYILLESDQANPLFGLFRDSAGYMLDPYGGIYFCATNFTDVLKHDSIDDAFQTVVNLNWQMVNNVMVSTPGGAFNTIQYKGNYTYSTSFALNPKFYEARSYTKQIGLVDLRNVDLFNPDIVSELQLVRYHVQ